MSKMRWRSRWTRRPVTVSVAAAVTVATMAVPAAAAGSQAVGARAAGPPVPVLHWRSCASDFQCATAQVPLNYQDPQGQTINIAMMRHLAAGPGRRLGSLFFNQGGPAPQNDSFAQAYLGLPAAVRARYDVVSFDMRGFGQSTTISCFPTQQAENKFLRNLPVFPVGHSQQQAWERTTARFDARCAKSDSALLAHDSTEDSARDMDVLRQAVGDPVLNYYGESYGTGLGAIYANLFPTRTGHMVFDGNIDPREWTQHGGLPGHLRARTDVSDAHTMAAFLSFCGRTSTSACAFSAGTPARTTAKWDQLLSRLLRHPAAVGNPLRVFTYADVVAEFPEYQVSSWPFDAAFLQQLWVNWGHRIPRGTPRFQPFAGVRLEQIISTACSDVPSPRNPAAYVKAARVATARSGAFGPLFAWQYEPCARWPRQAATDRFAGPWNAPTASTILLIGNTTDPATPYHDSVIMEQDLAHARLLTVHGWGHTEITNPSTCAAGYVTSYLLTGALPPAGTVCQQDAVPFGSSQR